MSTSVPPELLREVIREVVREVIREVVAEEIAAAAAAGALGRAGATGSRRPGEAASRPSAAPASPSAPAARGGEPVALQRGALTERHVRAVGKAGTITIGRAVVITPLARERARAMGVEIIRIEG